MSYATHWYSLSQMLHQVPSAHQCSTVQMCTASWEIHASDCILGDLHCTHAHQTKTLLAAAATQAVQTEVYFPATLQTHQLQHASGSLRMDPGCQAGFQVSQVVPRTVLWSNMMYTPCQALRARAGICRGPRWGYLTAPPCRADVQQCVAAQKHTLSAGVMWTVLVCHPAGACIVYSMQLTCLHRPAENCGSACGPHTGRPAVVKPVQSEYQHPAD